jgi:hypothetical protein
MNCLTFSIIWKNALTIESIKWKKSSSEETIKTNLCTMINEKSKEGCEEDFEGI